MVDRVGAVYVEVLTDTSGMKDAIERQSRKAAKWGGKEAADRWEDSFNKRMKKSKTNILKWNLTRAIDAQWDKIAKRQADKLQNAIKNGGKIKLEFDDADIKELEALADSLQKFARAEGLSTRNASLRKVLEQFNDRQLVGIQRAVKEAERALAQQEAEAKRAAEKAAAQAKRDADRRRREREAEDKAEKRRLDRIAKADAKLQNRFDNWLAGGGEKDAVEKFAREIERRVPVSVQRSLLKGTRDVDLGPELNDLAERISDRFGVSIRNLQRRVGTSIVQVVDAKDLAKFDKLESRILSFNRRFSRGGGAASVLGGFLTIPLAGAALALKTITAIPPVLAKAGGAVAKFGGIVGRMFPAAGAVLARVGAGIGAIAAKIAVLILPVALFAAWGAFARILSGFVALANAVASGLVIIGNALIGVVATIAPAAVALTGFVAGIGVVAVAVKPVVTALTALNTAVSSGKAEDWEKYNEALGKLGTNAQAAVKALRPLVESLKGFRQQLSENFFAGMAEGLGNLGPTLDIVKNGLSNLATAAGDVFDRLLGKLVSPEFQGALTTVLSGWSVQFTNLGNALSSFFLGFTNVFAALTPLANSLSGAIAGIADRFLAWTSSADNMATMVRWFQKAYDIAGQVWGIIGSLIGLVASLFNQSAPGTVGALESIKAKLDEWKLWVDNNSYRINTWMEQGKDTISNLATGIGDVVESFQKLNTPEARAGLDRMISLASTLLGIINAIASAWDRLPGFMKTSLVTVGGGSTRSNPVPSTINRTGLPAAGRSAVRAAGGYIGQPEFSLIGEAGPELVVPLRRNLNQVDPAVRSLSAMLQGKRYSGDPGYTGKMGGKVVNVTQHITPVSADPGSVAAQMLNRLVVVARS